MSKIDIPIYKLDQQESGSVDFEFQKMEASQPYNSNAAHRHNYFEIFYFVKGGGIHEIDFTKKAICDQSIHFLSPGQVHLVARTPDSHGFVIKFSAEFFKLRGGNETNLHDFPFFDMTADKAEISISRPDQPYIKDIFDKIQIEYSANETSKNDVLCAYLNILLIKSSRIYKEQEPDNVKATDSSNTLIRSFRLKIEEHFKSTHQLEDYAGMLHISSNHLSSTVKAALGKPASELIHERIILESKRLLYHSDQSVKEIAFDLGFSDPSYFSRYFKKREGSSPVEFRDTSH